MDEWRDRKKALAKFLDSSAVHVCLLGCLDKLC